MKYDVQIARNGVMKKVSFLDCRDKDDGKEKKNNMGKTNQNYMIAGTEKDHIYLNLKPC